MTGPAPFDSPETLRAEFFETVRRIVEASGSVGPVVGTDAPPADEPVRFSAARGSHHPDAEIGGASYDGAAGAAHLQATFMGLSGPSGVLPDHYSELVVTRDRARDEAFGEFLGMFDHRALALFYRAWSKYRMVVAFGERQGRLDDPASAALTALAGQAKPPEDPRLLAVAGLLARRVRSPEALKRTLVAMFELPIEIVELMSRRTPIRPSERTRLSAQPGGGAFTGLGHDAVAGISAVDVAGRFRVRVGPLNAAEFNRFFDSNGLRTQLVAAIRQIAGPTIDFDIQLVLQKDAVPQSGISLGEGPARLGHDSWLLHGDADRNRDDAILRSKPTDLQ